MKKLAASLLAASTILSLECGAMAYSAPMADTATTTVITLSDSISAEMLENLEESTTAYMTTEDGTQMPVDCTVTVKEVELPASRNADQTGAKSYQIEVLADTQKTISNSSDINDKKNNVKASAHMTMVWTDVSGRYNTIDKLSGNTDVTSGTIIAGKVSWGGPNEIDYDSRNVGSGRFTEYPNYTCGDEIEGDGFPIAGKLKSRYRVDFDEGVTLYVDVSPTIFD